MTDALELIRARRLACDLPVPALLVDRHGDMLFYNEPAEDVFGRPFNEIGTLPLDEQTAVLAPRHHDGRPIPAGSLPGLVAVRQRRPAHATFQILAFDGRRHSVEATAVPLEGAGGRLLGALVVLWPGRMARSS
jgi:PAS domain-containing protein